VSLKAKVVSSGWVIALRAGAALAAAVGVGRFVFTPILPLMQERAGVTAELGAALATSNYLGYMIGAIVMMAVPRWARSALALRMSICVLVLSLMAMPATELPEAWIALRGLAGLASAIMFVVAASVIVHTIPKQSHHLVGWSYGGVGAGIAISGAVVLMIAQFGDWREAWFASGVLTAILGAFAWQLVQGEQSEHTSPAHTEPIHRPHRWFVPLVAAYFLEGVGYIIAGTFLVAAIASSASGGLGKLSWIVVGLAAIPSCLGWAWLSKKLAHPTLLTIALLLQAAGIGLAALDLGMAGAVIAAVLFGGTFMGITTLALDAGAHLQVPTAVAILSLVYAVGQTAGPILVAPLLSDGFHGPLLIAAVIVALAAVSTALIRIRFPAVHRPASESTFEPVTAETVGAGVNR